MLIGERHRPQSPTGDVLLLLVVRADLCENISMPVEPECSLKAAAEGVFCDKALEIS
jgi:hypothetical protein